MKLNGIGLKVMQAMTKNERCDELQSGRAISPQKEDTGYLESQQDKTWRVITADSDINQVDYV